MGGHVKEGMGQWAVCSIHRRGRELEEGKGVEQKGVWKVRGWRLGVCDLTIHIYIYIYIYIYIAQHM